MTSQTQSYPGGHWGANNPIPTVQKFLRNLDREKEERDRQIDKATKLKQEDERNRQIQRGEQDEDTEVTSHIPLQPRKRGRKVTDPTTGREVEIDDVGDEFMGTVKEPQPMKTEPTQDLREYKRVQDLVSPPDPIAEGTTSDVPIHGEKTNILFHPTPSISYEPMYKALERRATVLSLCIFCGIVIPGKLIGGSLKGLIPIAICIASSVWLWMQDLIRKGRDMEWSSEQRRGEIATVNLLPESVEWMNTFLSIVWGLLNPEMFSSVADTIEDVMQVSVPGIIENVRVAEIDQGSNPFRILSLRALPDSQAMDLKNAEHEYNKETKSVEEAAADEEGGSHYNLECSFAYHSKPSGASSSSKAANMHMLLVFYLGIKGLFGVPLPVFAELIQLVGTVRLRLQMTPDPPFAKTLTFSLMGVPHVRAGCVPMVKRGVNILNLPLISNFVNYAIKTAASLYVAPKSMCIDLHRLLQGDTVQKDTQALGIMWIRIHRATGLSKQDRRGSEGGGSDPYINLSFSKYGKPMYCTRVITDDLNPVWEESAALLVTPELIKADEQLSVELWDSDRNTADDIVGKVEISIRKMLSHPGKMYQLTSKLQGMDVGSEMPGELHWEVGYFGKPRFRSALRTDGKDPNLPLTMKDNPALQDEKGTLDTDEAYAVAHTPPDPLWPSGICSVIIHQIVNLELANIKGSFANGRHRNSEYEPAKPYGEITDEEGKHLPTSYCTILLNDELIYRTRAKAVSSKPIFNAGTEKFVRDWRSAIVTVTVRDRRHREHDPILGVVPLKLSDILQTSSQVTRWYPLDGGIGFGRARISLLFRSVETRLPPPLLGWNVGSFQITSDRITALDYHHHAKLKVRTSGSIGSLPRGVCSTLEGGKGMYFDTSSKELKDRIRLPVKYRHRSAIIFELRKGDKLGCAVFWLNQCTDNEDADIDIPIWNTRNEARLTQNYITEEKWQQKRVPGLEDLTMIGRLQFKAKFSSGIDEGHRPLVQDNNSRETFETWEACISEGVRDRTISRELPNFVQELHDKSLIQERDILRRASSEERRRWIDVDGIDWREAFGTDPNEIADHQRRNLIDLGVEDHVRCSVSSLQIKERKSGESSHSAHLGRDSGSADNEHHTCDLENAADNDGEYRCHSESESESDTDTDAKEADSFTTTDTNRRSSETNRERAQRIGNKANKRTEHRKQRGIMQWKPARNAAFAKDEASFAIKKVKNRFAGGLSGREPDIETEVSG
ncbi:C2 domain-containing protein, nitrosative stress-induced transcript, conidia-enriched transcript [Histoplasma capsulatum]|uniref:C2 domain-containing protein, nitrosative stress-induced transcript, conidia-enriched transcript n=1 Tax=Ajellomyces capsulatus TaxID=5037 RepID=A0A8A1M5I7_AJECA|nr:conserved hypothetical protein [Histoplasma mississippiense (nom. inval.)]EDN03744.1 conserved hypothetical protein [Histoplasma mississippiense (nom. inval.)]QSS60580.1 C2 domain-containing protein, nitrosative stress-induced transcript, conidia-enriched transcript [Histoplasma capsulatum]